MNYLNPHDKAKFKKSLKSPRKLRNPVGFGWGTTVSTQNEVVSIKVINKINIPYVIRPCSCLDQVGKPVAKPPIKTNHRHFFHKNLSLLGWRKLPGLLGAILSLNHQWGCPGCQAISKTLVCKHDIRLQASSTSGLAPKASASSRSSQKPRSQQFFFWGSSFLSSVFLPNVLEWCVWE